MTLFYLSVSVSCVCVTFVVFTDCKLHQTHFHKPGIHGSGRVWANAWDLFRSTPFRDDRGRRAAVDFVVCFGCGGVLLCCFSIFYVSFEHTWPVAIMRPPCLIHLFCGTNCESCTRPIFTTPRSMGADEYMPEGRTCFIARLFEMVAIARLLWISWCVLGAAGFHGFPFFSNTHGLLQVRGRLASFTPLLVILRFGVVQVC